MTREDVLCKMESFRYRANVMVVDYRINGASKPIIIYDDHRYLLNVLFYAKQEGVFDDAVNLIYFDLHDDAVSLRPKESCLPKYTKAEQKARSWEEWNSQKFTKKERAFYDFVEFDVCPCDNTWLRVGMKADLIANAVNIGGDPSMTQNITNNNKKMLYGKHSIATLPINKLNRKIEIQPNCYEINTIVSPFVLDFDLDCFNGYTEDTFCQELVQNKPVYECIKGWISRASFITICREPMCCEGRVFGSTEKLGYLDKYFFDNAIRGC